MAAAKPLKIGLVLDDTLDSSDGVQQYVLTTGAWLSSQGHEVHYLVGQTSRADIANVHSLSRNVKVRFNGNRLSLPLPMSWFKARQVMAREQFDVLHVQMPYSPFLAQPLIRAAASETAVVGTFHILPYSGLAAAANRVLAFALRPTLKRFDSIVSVSSAAATFAKKQYDIDSSVLPNAIDYQRFVLARRSSTGKLPAIIFLGRLVPRKGCLILLQAVAEVRHTNPELHFSVRIGGKGPLLASLQAYVTQQHLGDVVTFDGFVPEATKPAYYAAADIAVFPSSSGESFGIVLAEAMASGNTAVLAGDNPGYRSVMEPRPELLFDPLSPHDLALKLETLLVDDRYRHTMALWGKDYSAHFDIQVVGTKIIELYSQALRKRPQL
jgi:phosphatidylinositol alpha-mannosyltransferase